MTTTTGPPEHVATARELANSEHPMCPSCDKALNPSTGECPGCSD